MTTLFSRALRGVNLNGGEFGTGVNIGSGSGGTFSNENPGVYDTAFHYDTQASLSYLNGRGVTHAKIMFRWERLQPVLGGVLDATEAARLDAIIARCATAGIAASLCPANYGAYWVEEGGAVGVRRAIGSAQVLEDDFADLWGRIAARYNSNASVEAYWIMAEPLSLASASAWESAAQAAVSEIRANDTTTKIIVGTYEYSSMTVLATHHPSGPWITDSNIAWDCHQYLGTYFGDVEGGSYSYASANSAAVTAGYDSLLDFELTARCAAFDAWLDGADGIVGEFGWPNSRFRPTDYADWDTVGAATIDYYNSKGWGWFAWGVGEWWGQDYLYSPWSASTYTLMDTVESFGTVIEARDVPLSAWTTTASGTGASVTVEADKLSMVTGTATYGKTGARNTDALASTDYTLTVDITIPAITEWYFFVHLRGAATFSNTYKILSSYQVRFTSYLGAIIPELYQVNGSGTESAALAAGVMTGTPVAGDTVRIKIEVSESTSVQLKQKAWIVGATEPGYTDLSAGITVDYTGSYFSLSAQGGNNTTSETFWWGNPSVESVAAGNVDAATATGSGAASNALAATRGYAYAGLASSHGAAVFDGAGEQINVTLEALDAVGGHGEALGAQKAHNSGTATGSGVANSATVGGSRNIPAQSLTKTAVANNATVKAATGPATATGGGVAHQPTVSTATGTIGANAEPALATGDASGIGYILDEDGFPLLDELGNPLADGAGVTVRVTSVIGAAAGTGTVTAAQRGVKATAGVGVSVAAALQPTLTTTGGATTTNVNAAVAVSVGAANVLTAAVAPTSATGSGAGTAEPPATTAPVQAIDAVSVGAAYDAVIDKSPPTAEAVGQAFDAQVDVDANNFAAVAAIPISATAGDATTLITTNASAAESIGTADRPDIGARNEPGQLVTIRDRGHTVTLKER